MDSLSLDTYIKTILKGKKTILLFTAGFFLASIVYTLFFYNPSFTSSSKILIQDLYPTSFVTELGGEKKLTTQGNDKNPILTQMEILSSWDMAEKVYDSLVRNNNKLVRNVGTPTVLISKIQKAIKLKNPTSTDIIEIKVSWNQSETAKNMAQLLLQDYYLYNVDLNRQSIRNTGKYIDDQLQDSQTQLETIREEIKNYRKLHASVDLNTEIEDISKQVSDTENTIASLTSQIGYNQGKVKALSSKLNIQPDHIKQSLDLVALGQNENLNKLKNSLNEAQQQYATLQVRYPMGTKKMSSLKQNINELTEQIQTESTLTIGKEVKPSDQKNIKDTVRTKMVNDLVESQDEVDSLLSEKQVLAHTLSMLKAEQNNLPDQQKTLGDLLEKETNLSQVVNTLSTKLVEAKVRESEISSNITIVQNPTTPEKAPFPTRTHTMALFTLAGLLAGVFTVLSKHYYRNKAGNLNEVESILEAPVLTNLSWLPAASYHSNHVSTSTGILQEYQKLVTALKIKKEDLGLSVIGFSHLGKGARRANIINNIATQLANCHYTVLIINANFERTVPSSDFSFDITTSPDFKKLLIRKEESLLLQDYVVRIDPKRSIYLMSSPDTVLSSYELVNSKKFPVIINEMKKQFDFVLVDMPEILYSPDSVVIARMLDGVVSICGVDTTKEDLLETRKTCQRNAINLVGAITKDCN